MMKPFKPRAGSTVSLAASTTSARVALTNPPSNSEFQVRVHNAGSALAFIHRGNSTVTAATTDVPIPSGAVEVLTFENLDGTPQTHVAAITTSGTATLYFTIGFGV